MRIPKDARVLSAEYRAGAVYVWVLCEMGQPNESRTFLSVKDWGEVANEDLGRLFYVGRFWAVIGVGTTGDGYHLFEIKG